MTQPTPSLEERVRRLLADEIAPALSMDGSALEVVGIDHGVVQLRLVGVCGHCPSSVMALIMGIEQELRRHLPEVDYVEMVP
ncbi:MAG: NifU family protein [Gemmataceae bacterium]|nr:NifU family protein [Gemmataceae bacterium]MDW8264717.1 NifU family protein [Gemmataceae bacterium]